jgi:hypothetical protein
VKLARPLPLHPPLADARCYDGTMRWALATSLLLTLASAPAKEPRKVLPFIEDDYGKALSEARAKNLPLFIDAWAPW